MAARKPVARKTWGKKIASGYPMPEAAQIYTPDIHPHNSLMQGGDSGGGEGGGGIDPRLLAAAEKNFGKSPQFSLTDTGAKSSLLGSGGSMFGGAADFGGGGGGGMFDLGGGGGGGFDMGSLDSFGW